MISGTISADRMNIPDSPSPSWSTNTKLVVGLTLVAIAAGLLIYIRGIIGPLLLAFTLSYVLHPVADLLSRSTRLNWRTSVNLVFLVVLVLVGGSLTWSGLAIVQQFQILIGLVQTFVEVTLPSLAADLSTNVYSIGPFILDLTQFDLRSLTDQVLGIVQPVLVQSGTILSSFATGAAATLGWLLFVLVVSYFLLAEAGRVPSDLFHLDIPGYEYDVQRMVLELQRIWNAFLRGMLIIFAIAVILNLILFSILGLRLGLVIALLAGLAKFVPYLGPASVLVMAGVVSIFQAQNVFGLLPWQYTLLVLVAIFVLDQSFDNLVTPRLLGRQLDLHPAAILVAALIVFNLIGIVGLILVAPVLATIKLFGRYALHKMVDQDPWRVMGDPPPPFEIHWQKAFEYIRNRKGRGREEKVKSEE
jgi:predicted PurR-regulated permease PerM